MISIPWVARQSQFSIVEKWFETREPPHTLVFCDNKGRVTLSGIRWRGHSGNTFMLGRLGADVAIFDSPRKLKSEYSVAKLLSRIDGLHSFTSFRSIDQSESFEGGVRATVVTVKAADRVSWRHGGFTYTIRASVPWKSTSGLSFTAHADAVIETSRSKRATVGDHISAQWPLRALLILAHGSKLHWREHMLLDEQFPMWMMSGEAKAPTYVPVQHRKTIRDFEQSEDKTLHAAFPAFQLEDLGTRGLLRWFKLYDDSIVRRAIDPVVEVLNGATRFLEPQVLMTVHGLEAMGHFRDPKREKWVRLNTQIQRCISATRNDWSKIGPEIGIAKAIANVNNDLKHPDRPNRPGGLELSLVANLSRSIMRMQLFDLLKLPRKMHAQFMNSAGLYDVISLFELNGTRIDQDGRFVSR